MEKNISIYGLVDPIDGQIKYIGNTHNPKKRRYNHISTARIGRSGRNNKWIRSLMQIGLKPTMKILLETTEANRWLLEEEFIKHYKQFCILTNTTDGGKGAKGTKHSEKYKEAARQRMLGESNPGKKQMKPIVQYSLNGDVIREWDCTAHAAKELKFNVGGISKTCKNRMKSSYGFLWKYKY